MHRNFPSRQNPNPLSNQIKFTKCQKNQEILVQSSPLICTVQPKNDLIDFSQIQEQKITLDNVDHIFLVVPHNFPLTEDGIAGRPSLEKEDAIILAKQRKIIFKRTNPNYEILKFDSKYSLDRSRLLQENARINHILNENEKNEFWSNINSFQDIYYLEGDPLPCTYLTEHKIETNDEQPINIERYRYPPAQHEEIEQQI
ncbi:hypothetical protein PV325_010104 [Microctonus aethiopoides]|nr:hypothetical protein PV325_010104 [Microctonus aethiopoides]